MIEGMTLSKPVPPSELHVHRPVERARATQLQCALHILSPLYALHAYNTEVIR